MKLSEYIEELQERLQEYGDEDILLEGRGREPYIRNTTYGGRVYGFVIY